MAEITWKAVKGFLRSLGKDTITTSWGLLKITLPVILLTKLLEEAGIIVYLSKVLGPVMNLVGLPGEFALVWATALLTNLYGAMAVFASLVGEGGVTAAQATILCSMMLIAHALPVELSISKKAGAPFFPIALIRIGGALLYGYILNVICSTFNLWQEPAICIFAGELGEDTLWQWGVAQITNLGLIVVIIFCILIMMRFLEASGILGLLSRGLEPLLPPFGMSHRAAPLTVVGMVMGISYGGALIIRETSGGKLQRREVFFSLALMGMSHALIEDTLLMMALGGYLTGILWGRLAFSLLVIYTLTKILKN